MDRMVNYIKLAWKMACILKTYRTCNSMVGFSKYEFNNKLLCGVILLKVTSGVTWTQPIYMCVCVCCWEEKEKNWATKTWATKHYSTIF